MNEISDVVIFFSQVIDGLKKSQFTLLSPLDEIVIKSAGHDFAYMDNRKVAMNKYNFDIWKDVQRKMGGAKLKQLQKTLNVGEQLLYSESKVFPDYLFKVKEFEGNFRCGCVLELKDSKASGIASFNSTIPTRFKSLREIDVINGNEPSLVSKIASIIDGKEIEGEYYSYSRRCFYLVRTHKENGEKVKISIIDGSFFETVPKDDLIYQSFLQILQGHIDKENLSFPEGALKQIKEVLSHITDQSIIAGSRQIEGASIKPRFRIMAEVHSEGNPHSSHYPQIIPNTFNLILNLSLYSETLKEEVLKMIPELKVLKMKHLRNGEFVVFQYNLKPEHSKQMGIKEYL